MSGSNVWSDFMASEYAQSELKKIEKQAQQWSVNMDRGPLYDKADPGNKTELSQSATTQGVSGGGGSMVGSEDRKPLYTMKTAPTPGGEEEYADTTVEGLEDIQSAMMEVAMKAPTGKPLGTQDNMPEKWDGMQAAGKARVKNFTKKADALMEADDFGHDEGHSDETQELDFSEASLEQLLEEMNQEESDEGHAISSHDLMEAMGSANKKKTVAFLKELVKIANELDQKGQHTEASEIDAVVKDEVQALLATAKKK
jgi:hypothetical protein